MTIEIVDFPINSMVIFNSYVKLPEGIHDEYRECHEKRRIRWTMMDPMMDPWPSTAINPWAPPVFPRSHCIKPIGAWQLPWNFDEFFGGMR